MSFLFSSANVAPVAAPVPSKGSDEKETSDKPGSSTEVKQEVTSLVPMVKAGGVLVAAGMKKKGKTKSSRLGTRGFARKLPPDGFLYNPTGRPAIWRPPPNNSVFRVMQSYEVVPYATSSASVTTFQAANFTVNQLDQISSLTGVFDQYRIVEVECWIEPRVTNNGSASQNTGRFHSVVDYDDSTVLSTVAQALDYTNVVVSSGLVGHYRRFKPHVAVAAYSGAFTSFANEESPWIDAASPSVQHYGLKSVWSTTDVAYAYDMFVRLHTEWRNVR